MPAEVQFKDFAIWKQVVCVCVCVLAKQYEKMTIQKQVFYLIGQASAHG